MAGSASSIRAGKAYVELGTDDNLLKAGLDKAKRMLQTWGTSLQSIGSSMGRLGLTITAPFVLAAKIFENSGSELVRLAGQTGSLVESLSALGYAAGQVGVDLESMAHSVGHMQRNCQRHPESAAALALLHLRAADLVNLAPDEQLSKIAAAISAIGNPALKTAAAMAVFGRSGAELLPLLNQGRAGISAFVKQASALGLIMSTEDATAADELRKSLSTLWAQLKAIAIQVGSALAPSLQALARFIGPILKSSLDWIRENRALVATVAGVGAALVITGGALFALGTIATGVAAGIGVLTTAFGLLASVVGAILSPVGLVVAALGGLGYVLLTKTEAGQQALGYLGKKFTELKSTAVTAWGGISAALQSGDLAAAAEVAAAGMQVAWLQLVADLVQPWADAKAKILSGWEELSAYAQAKMTTVQIYWSEMTAFFSEEWTRAHDLPVRRVGEVGRVHHRRGQGLHRAYVAAWTFVKSEFLRLVDVMSAAWERLARQDHRGFESRADGDGLCHPRCPGCPRRLERAQRVRHRQEFPGPHGRGRRAGRRRGGGRARRD